jgi:acyl-CoA dehydrogenase
VGFVFRNVCRTFLLALTNGVFLGAPVQTKAAPYYRRLTRLSAAFALTADVAMGTLGAALKRKEALTGRLADVLAWMYIASAALKRFHDDGSKERDLPYLRWSCDHALHETQRAFFELFANLPLRPAGWLLRVLAFPFGRAFAPPRDACVHAAAAGLLDGGAARGHLTRGIYLPASEEPGLGRLEAALDQVVRAQAVQKKIASAVREKRLEKRPAETLVERALASAVINAGEKELLAAADRARDEAIAVDAFPQRSYAEMGAGVAG